MTAKVDIKFVLTCFEQVTHIAQCLEPPKKKKKITMKGPKIEVCDCNLLKLCCQDRSSVLCFRLVTEGSKLLVLSTSFWYLDLPTISRIPGSIKTSTVPVLTLHQEAT